MQQRMAEVLGEFARTIATDFPVEATPTLTEDALRALALLGQARAGLRSSAPDR